MRRTSAMRIFIARCRSVPELGAISRRLVIVIVEEATEALPACHVTFRRGVASRLQGQLIVESLMIAFSVVVLDIFSHGVAKVALTQRDNLSNALEFDGADGGHA